MRGAEPIGQVCGSRSICMFSRPSNHLLEMTWEDGLFIHWPVEPDTIASTLPDGLSVATHDEDAWLGIVPFEMADIRPVGSPIGRSFPELNLRTYVDGPAGKGVYFYNLDAADRVGVQIARRLFSLPYYTAEMAIDRSENSIRFQSRRTDSSAPPARFDATYRPTGDVFTANTGSLEAFLTENYRFYAHGNRLYTGTISHEPWPLQDAIVNVRSNTLFKAAGFTNPSEGPHVQYSKSIDVTAGGPNTV